MEYARFVKMPFKREQNIWQWFKTNETVFPRLRNVALKCLLLPASSASSERLFSKAGNIVTTKRNCLLTDIANDLTVLSSNPKILKKL